jgi:peptidoglycan/LPS O-acetylase OafA/YrhL
MVLNGHAALMSFFVLSGFVLTLSLRRGPQPPLSASLTFVGARLLRIIPVNAIAVLAAVAIATIAGAAPQARVPPPWDWPRIVANMILLETTIDPVAWSLTVELLSVPFIVGMYLVARRWGPLPLLVATAATLGLSFAPRWLGFQPLGQNLFAVSMGMLVAEIGARIVGGISRRRATAWFAFASVLWFVTRALLGRWSHWASVAEACAAAIMIALIVSGPALAPYRAFELRPILWLGEISFSLYLYHALLWPWVAPSAGASMFVRLGGWGPLAAVFATWVVTIAVTIPAAWLSYVIVERAGIGAGRVLRRARDIPVS